jgi:uncharacterized protein (TIRG00374 family)
MRSRLLLRLVVSLAVAAALVAALFHFGGISLADTLRTLASLSPATYGLALLLHFVTYCLRAARFQALIPEAARPSFRHALTISAAHNLASYVLPLKAGEASLIVYLRLQCGTPAGIALAALLVSRFLDAASLCAGLAAACWVLRDEGAAPRWMGSASVLLLIAAGLFLLLSLRGDLLVRAVEWGLRWLRLHRLRPGARFLEKLAGLASALRAASGGWRLSLSAVLTAPMWFTVFGFYALLAGAFGIPESVGFLERALGASLAALFNLLPMNAMAGAGTQELGWVTGFHGVLGVEEGAALASGIAVHVVQLFNIVAMGLIAHLAMGVMPRWRLGGGLDDDRP